jgi:Holliday junction resolvase-like predicted endonuclease
MIERLRTDKVDHVKVEKLIKKIEIYLSTKEKEKKWQQIINIELLLTMVQAAIL